MQARQSIGRNAGDRQPVISRQLRCDGRFLYVPGTFHDVDGSGAKTEVCEKRPTCFLELSQLVLLICRQDLVESCCTISSGDGGFGGFCATTDTAAKRKSVRVVMLLFIIVGSLSRPS